MKLVFALILAGGSMLFGLSLGKRAQKKERCLAAVLEALQYIRAELTQRGTPLPEVFSELSCSGRPQLRGFFAAISGRMDGLGDESLAKVWQEEIMKNPDLLLSEAQRLEFCRPGLSLGKYEASEQAAAIDVCVQRLEQEYVRAIENTRQALRLYTGLGLTAGLMLATVLM